MASKMVAKVFANIFIAAHMLIYMETNIKKLMLYDQYSIVLIRSHLFEFEIKCGRNFHIEATTRIHKWALSLGFQLYMLEPL